MITLTYLEFYSGIGGWGYALEHACQSVQAVTAAIAPPSPNNGDHLQLGVPRVIKRPKVLSLDGDGERDEDGSDSAAGVTTIPPHLELRPHLLAAYDHSDLCNAVFYHNHNHVDRSSSAASPTDNISSSSSSPVMSPAFKKKKEKKKKREHERHKPRQTPIERLTLSELESHSAAVWCMSPPCQPHTRQHSNRHTERNDPRSRSFFHLCSLLGDMEEGTLPSLILLENVVGFERSCCAFESGEEGNDDGDAKGMGSFEVWRRTLSRRNYRLGHFHLDPTHVGIPNTRPRHYTVAYRRPNRESLLQRLMKNGTALPGSALTQFSFLGGKYDNLICREMLDEPPVIHDEKSLEKITGMPIPELPRIGSFLDADLSPITTTPNQSKEEALRIPEKVRTSSSSWCFDIATQDHRHSSCFTHSYGKFVRGTGSILYTGPLSSKGDSDRFRLASPEERSYDASWSEGLDWDRHVRYLSGTEIARLMGFPVMEGGGGPSPEGGSDAEGRTPAPFREFRFPEDVAEKRQWKLLGNSLNVRVAGRVAEIGIVVMLNDLGSHNEVNNR